MQLHDGKPSLVEPRHSVTFMLFFVLSDMAFHLSVWELKITKNLNIVQRSINPQRDLRIGFCFGAFGSSSQSCGVFFSNHYRKNIAGLNLTLWVGSQCV